MLTVKIDIDPALLRALNADLTKAAEAASVALASEIQDRIAPYPPPLPNQRYIRGYGYPGGPKTSQMLGRRWGITKRRSGAILGNTATYAPDVHHYATQAHVHRGRWVTDKQAVEAVKADGTIDTIVAAALKAVL